MEISEHPDVILSSHGNTAPHSYPKEVSEAFLKPLWPCRQKAPAGISKLPGPLFLQTAQVKC